MVEKNSLRILNLSIRVYSFLVAFHSSINSISQNLIPDPSFEKYKKCPTSITTAVSNFNSLMKWNIPTKGTTDYFNSCASPKSLVSVPRNIAGYAYPRSGEGYVGVVNTGSRWREYIQCRLLSPLSPNEQYHVEFWISHAEHSKFCIAQLGLALTIDRPLSYSSKALDLQPQIHSTECLADTANWTRISGTYTARGGEQWVTIGCFFPGKNALTRITPKRNNARLSAYYYIDDVYVGLSMPEDSSVLSVPQDTLTIAAQPRSFLLPGVLFATGKSELSATAYKELDVIVAEMLECISCRFEIIGHTDDQGSAEFNQALSQARASEVAAYFMAKGIATTRVDASGRGAAQPVADNSTEEGRALNRRVEIVVREEMPRE